MATITKIYNRITLREEPDASPIVDGSFSKSHSFIFPGDELVMCTKIKGAADLIPGATDFSGIGLQSVKVSIIAKKPNIFTSEFTRHFTSTRSFELDSFLVPLNSSNAPIVPWGADGYAPNINFQQNRSWAMPNGNFKKLINFFTEHTPGTTEWDYSFYYPFIFREEYWKALAAADNDFYNILQPQNGKNQKWLRYHDLSVLPFGWQIHVKFELTYNYMSPLARYAYPFIGDPYVLVSEYNLSNEQTGIQDYNSNPDYNTKSIKTCNVGGTPSASGFIFGYQNTSCFGYFTKATAWDAGEKLTLNAIFRIRPFEGGDFLGSRVNSKEAVTNDIVWAAMAEHIKANTGLRIKANTGKKIVTNRSGSQGLRINFDPLDDKNIIVNAEIDYNKLNAIFPGITKFTLYCRLYNGTTLLGTSTTTVGTFNITGVQFVQNASGGNYDVAGIPAGYTYDSIELPEGWALISRTVLSGTSERFNLSTGIGSGTIIVTYKQVTVAGTLYRKTAMDVYSGNCRMGEEITRFSTLIPSNPQPPILTPSCPPESECPSRDQDCPFTIDVFADVTDTTNDLKNDKTDFYGLQYMGNAGISAIEITLQKNDSNCGGCNWTDKYKFVEDTTNPYGLFFAFGHNPDFSGVNFQDDYGNKYTGLMLNWLKVLVAFGAGQYRMKIVYTSAINGTTWTDYDVRIFCLHQWTCYNINGTVRIETINSGFRGNMNNSSAQIDYGSGWKGQIRLKGIFYEVKPNYNKEFNQYADAEFNAFKPIIHELIPKFTMDIKPAPGWIDWLLSNYILLADQILVTDYNAANRKPFIKTPVVNENGIDTKDADFVNSLAWSQVQFSYGQNNLRRRNN